jgi:hypothetical protein
VTDTGSHGQGSELVQVRKALSHRAQGDSSTNIRRADSGPLTASTDNMTDYNLFPMNSKGIRQNPKGVLMVKESQRVFKDLGFCKTTT